MDQVTTDLDSVVIVARRCHVLKINQKFPLFTAENYIYPSYQRKTTIILDPMNTKYWYEFTLGGEYTSLISVLFSLKNEGYKKPDDPGKHLYNVLTLFFEEIKKLKLPSKCRTVRLSNLNNFTMFDKWHQPVVYPEDWIMFCEALDKMINNIKPILLDQFQIDDVFYIRYAHGLKLQEQGNRPNFVRVMSDLLNVDLTSDGAELIQIHVANTLIPKNDQAVLVKYSELKGKVFRGTSDYNKYRCFHLDDYGHLISR